MSENESKGPAEVINFEQRKQELRDVEMEKTGRVIDKVRQLEIKREQLKERQRALTADAQTRRINRDTISKLKYDLAVLDHLINQGNQLTIYKVSSKEMDDWLSIDWKESN
jgi:hypothetical protein